MEEWIIRICFLMIGMSIGGIATIKQINVEINEYEDRRNY